MTTEVIVCSGRAIRRLVAQDMFAGYAPRRDIVHFVSVMSRRPRFAPRLPVNIPAARGWFVQVLARDGRIVIGRYRRHMKTIAHLGKLDEIFGVPVTTRGWKTIVAAAAALQRQSSPSRTAPERIYARSGRKPEASRV